MRGETGKKTRQKRESLGRRAEFLAAQFLRLKGFRILETRFKTKAGEIDLIAAKKDLLVFVEVKARQNLQTARESVSYGSQQRIKQAASIFTARRKAYQNMGHRYDAVFLIGRFSLKHEPDFFK